jgi:hypothetical protein
MQDTLTTSDAPGFKLGLGPTIAFSVSDDESVFYVESLLTVFRYIVTLSDTVICADSVTSLLNLSISKTLSDIVVFSDSAKSLMGMGISKEPIVHIMDKQSLLAYTTEKQGVFGSIKVNQRIAGKVAN